MLYWESVNETGEVAEDEGLEDWTHKQTFLLSLMSWLHRLR